ncbi:hypothetical protein BDZ89DRAFT_45292 [Hymenopellis radicata]|nr:hypothetical protein BDZ89DRAFT_45292 [Hymenopellis radicata]
MSFAPSKPETNRQPSRRPKPSLTLSTPSGNGHSLVTDGTPSTSTRKHITNAPKHTPSQPMQSQPGDDISGPLPSISARPPADRSTSTRARALSSPSTPSKVRRPATAPSLAAPTSSTRGLPSPIGPRAKAAQGSGSASPMSSSPRDLSSKKEERPRTAESNFVDASNFTSYTSSRNRRSPESSSLPAPSASSASTSKYPGQPSTQNTFSSARRAPAISEKTQAITTSGPPKLESSFIAHNASTATSSSLKSAFPSPSHTRPPLTAKSSSPSLRPGMASKPLRPTRSFTSLHTLLSC